MDTLGMQKRFAWMIKTANCEEQDVKAEFVEVQEGNNTTLLAIEEGVALLENWL
jgi:hypothetical protein